MSVPSNKTLNPAEWTLLRALILDEVNHTGIPPAEPVVDRLGMTPKEGGENLDGLELLGMVSLRRVSGTLPYVQVKWPGREEAHQRGESIPSPRDDARDLLAFLRNPGGDVRPGSDQVNDSDIIRRFGWHQARALDAARVLADHDQVKLHTPSGSFFLFLTASGRRSA